MKKRVKGSITVYLSLTLCVILVLISACMYSARIVCGKGVLSMACDEGMFTLFSNYDKTLYEEYGLLFLDSGYGRSQMNMGDIVDEYKREVEKVLGKGNASLNTPYNQCKITLEEPEVYAMELATDNGFSSLKEQIVSYMTERLGKQGIKNIADRIFNSSSEVASKIGEGDTDLKGLTQRYDEIKQEASEKNDDEKNAREPSQSFPRVEVPRDFVNPLDNLLPFCGMGAYSFALPGGKKQSVTAFNRDEFVSNRNRNQGFGDVPKEESNMLEKPILCEYVLDHFPCFLEEVEDESISYQQEYIIAGGGGDSENEKAVLDKIMMIRTGFNMAHLLSSPGKQAAVENCALIIASLLTVPWLSPFFTMLLNTAWSYAESMLDVKALLAGERVPLIKNEMNWRTSFEGLADLSMDTVVSKEEKGMDYRDYLRLLLYFTSDSELIGRIADMTEYNVRMRDKSDFSLDNCISYIEIDYPGVFSCNTRYGYNG